MEGFDKTFKDNFFPVPWITANETLISGPVFSSWVQWGRFRCYLFKVSGGSKVSGLFICSYCIYKVINLVDFNLWSCSPFRVERRFNREFIDQVLR